MTDYDALRAAAEAATPGPWGQRVDDVRSIYGGNDELVVDTCGWDRDYDNAVYIATASPDVVLGLHAHVGLGELWQASDRRREVAATAEAAQDATTADLTAAAPHSDQPDADHDGERGGEAGGRA